MTLIDKAILAAALVLSGCARINKDLSHSPPYQEMIGKVYTTKVDMLVYQYKGEKSLQIAEPGSNQGIPPAGFIATEYPFRWFDTELLGVLPKGTEMELIEVREEGNSGLSFPTFYCKVTLTTAQEWMEKIVSPQDLESLGGGE